MRGARINNVDLQEADFYDFSVSHGFDRILITASLPAFDDRLAEWLKPGGLTIAPVGEAPAMSVERIERSDEHYTRTALFETVVPRLINAPNPDEFRF